MVHWVTGWGGAGQQQHHEAALGTHRVAVAGGVGQGGVRVPDWVIKSATVWLVVGDQGKFRKSTKMSMRRWRKGGRVDMACWWLRWRC